MKGAGMNDMLTCGYWIGILRGLGYESVMGFDPSWQFDWGPGNGIQRPWIWHTTGDFVVGITLKGNTVLIRIVYKPCDPDPEDITIELTSFPIADRGAVWLCRYLEFLPQLLEAMKNPDLLPTCMGMGYDKMIWRHCNETGLSEEESEEAPQVEAPTA
jgi:hypothetical protein